MTVAIFLAAFMVLAPAPAEGAPHGQSSTDALASPGRVPANYLTPMVPGMLLGGELAGNVTFSTGQLFYPSFRARFIVGFLF